MSTSTKSSTVILTHDAAPLASYGIYPDIRGMPPAMKYSLFLMDRLSRLQWWSKINRMHQLEEWQGGLSVYWPPGQRITMTSQLVGQHRYGT